jgi:3-oxoacyl-[acyl-carrier protein] reductase
MMKGVLAGKKVFVTGGSRGIGAAIVMLAVDQGAMVGFTYLDSVDDAERISVYGQGRCLSYKADVTDLSSLERAVADFSKKGDSPGMEGLVVNAGIYRRTDITNLTPEMWNRTMDVNLNGAYNTVKAVSNHMTKGSIVIVSSQLAIKGSGHGSDYAASKAGMLGFARSLAKELSPDIRVNSVAPGYVDTDLLSSDSPEKRRSRCEEVPLKRIAQPGEIAGPVVFLLSDMASYITGATLDINGGLLIR